MAQLICVGCGKHLVVDPSVGGGDIVCPACGAIAAVPGPRPSSAALTPSRRRVGELPPHHDTSRLLSITLALSAAAVLIILLIWLVLAPSPKPSLVSQVNSLKSEAEALAVHGDLAAAHECYRRIDQLVSGRDLRNAELRALVDRARHDAQDVYRLLLFEEQRKQLEGILALKSEAERLALLGDFESAHGKYQELELAAASLSPEVPLPAGLLDRVRSDQDRVFALLLEKRHPVVLPAVQPQVPATQPATQPAHPQPTTVPGAAAQPSLSPPAIAATRYGMTAGGLASLLAVSDCFDPSPAATAPGRPAYPPRVAAAVAWLENGDNCLGVNVGPVQYVGYNLFALSRVGSHLGLKHLGKHEWYAQLAARILALQFHDGSWGATPGANSTIETAYTLLFLSAGRHPVLFNKLRYEGAWNDRPRDIANLSRFAVFELQHPLAWRVADLRRDWSDWLDSPILYIAGHLSVKFADADCVKLRAFVQAGGMIFAHADGGSPAFNDAAAALARRLFNAPLIALPAGHPIYSIRYPLDSKPELRYVGNGARILMLHSPKDIASSWQSRDLTRRHLLQLGVNIFEYACGRPDLKAGTAVRVPPEIGAPPALTISVARLTYTGNCDPGPFAWQRFARYFRQQTDWSMNCAPVAVENFTLETAPVAHLTGTAALVLTPVQSQAIRRYVQGGGVLLIDACGGSPAFANSIPAILQAIFPESALQPLGPEHPLLAASAAGMVDLSKAQYRRGVNALPGKPVPSMAVLHAGKGGVLFSRLDITEGILACPAWGIFGYSTDYAQDLVRNILLWAADRAAAR